MEKILWARKRLRLYLSLSRPAESNDILAYAQLSALNEDHPSATTSGDLALLKACQEIYENNAAEVVKEKNIAKLRLSEGLNTTASLAL